jgi:hypothetical protein
MEGEFGLSEEGRGIITKFGEASTIGVRIKPATTSKEI